MARLTLMLAVSMVPALAWSPPARALGPEFQVNTYTTVNQGRPTVAADGAGKFVVVWTSVLGAGSDNYNSIQAQRYDAAGLPAGGQFQVNSYTTGNQVDPAVAADAAGNVIVVWGDGTSGDPFSGNILAQRYDGSGAPLGGEFQVNSYTPNSQFQPAVAADGAGNFVVAWTSRYSALDGDHCVRAQRYDAAGVPQGAEFQVNSYTTGFQGGPAVAFDGSGKFVVVWTGAGDGDPGSIDARRYDASGVPLGGQFQVNTYTTGGQFSPAVAADGAGNIFVAWESSAGDGSDTDRSVQGRRYDASGAPLGGQFQVNTYTSADQFSPAVAADSAGNVVVAWSSVASAGSDVFPPYGASVQAQRYDTGGAPVGNQFQVNTYTTERQWYPAVAADGAGKFVVAWESYGSAGSDTNGYSIQGQRYAPSSFPLTDQLAGRAIVIKPGSLAKFAAKPVSGDTFDLPSADPVAVGGTLRIFDTSATAGDDSYALPAGATPPLGWKALGSPPGSSGYRYRGAGLPGDPCTVVLVKDTVIKGVCRRTGVALAPPFSGDVGVVLSFGTTDRYCARFGGRESRNDATLTQRRKAPAPGACP